MYNRSTPTSASAVYPVGALIWVKEKAVDVLTACSTYIRIRTNPSSVYHCSTAMTDLIYPFDLIRSYIHCSTSVIICQYFIRDLVREVVSINKIKLMTLSPLLTTPQSNSLKGDI